MKTSANKTALITGASSGIGLALARLFAADGYDLILISRRADLLSRLAGEIRSAHHVRVDIIPIDLAEPLAARSLWHAIEETGAGIEALVNNAGFGDCGEFANESCETIERMIQLNVSALTMLTRLALPAMVARRSGKILNVASLASLQPGGPGMSVYYATKSYVLAFSRGIRSELRGSGVSVTALCPGPTATGFEHAAGAQQTRLFSRMRPMPARIVARAGYLGLQRGSAIVVPGRLNQLLAMSWVLPSSLALAINRLLLARRS